MTHLPKLRNPRIHDIRGQRFGRLTVIDLAPGPKGITRWLCRCDCGNHHIVQPKHLGKNGHTKSCGCLLKEKFQEGLHRTHGKSRSTEYGIWAGMITRCCNPNSTEFHRYGKRGIDVCQEWRMSFEAFYRDIGPRPSPQHSLERKNNELGYSPDNCKWSMPMEQANNRRSNRLIEYRGEIITLRQAMEKAGCLLSYDTVRARVHTKNWPLELALQAPLCHRPHL